MSREKVYLVDKNDRVISEKWRDELLDTDCWRIATIWVQNAKGEVLIQQRAHDKQVEPGKWAPGASGTVSKGDSYDETAHKELVEELGVKDIYNLTKNQKVHFKSSWGSRFNQLYSCVIDLPLEDFIMQKEEVIDLKWITRQELANDLKNNPHRYIQNGDWKQIYNFTF